MGNRSKIETLLLVALDVFLINMGFALAFGLRFNLTWPKENLTPYFVLIPWLSLSAVIIFYMFDMYANWQRKNIYNLVYSIVFSVLALDLWTMVLTFWYRGFAFPRSVFLLSIILQITIVTLCRSILWLISKHLFGRKKVLIIGEHEEDQFQVAEKFLEHTKGWFQVQEFVLVTEINNFIKIELADVVLLCPNVSDKTALISRCVELGKEVLVVPGIYELHILGSEVQQVDDMVVLSVQPPKLNSSQLLVKRFVDIIISVTSLILFSPIIICLYFLIPITSHGPALFRQERLGKDSKPYNILKFRSMVMDAEKTTGPVLASVKDPRITALGRFIRATRLDELPQLINVLKGEMSLVGPRPERPFFCEQFQALIPHYTHRLAVKPGITGLAQVMAKYTTSVEYKLSFDVMYVRNYSLAMDVKILFQTIRVVLQREQADGVKMDRVRYRANVS
jgi:exopolysaccharide biosynthesis polyprenyl glycosylphosphotransferase